MKISEEQKKKVALDEEERLHTRNIIQVLLIAVVIFNERDFYHFKKPLQVVEVFLRLLMLIWRTAEVFLLQFSRQFFVSDCKEFLAYREEMSLKKLLSESSFGFTFRTLTMTNDLNDKDSKLVYGFIFIF